MADIKKADRFLMQIRNTDKELTDILNQINYLRYKASGATGIRYDKDHVQTSPSDMVCEALTEAVDLERKLSDRNRELLQMRQQAEDITQLLSDNECYLIRCYYLDRISMTETADRLHMSSRNAYRVKASALIEFSKHL